MAIKKYHANNGSKIYIRGRSYKDAALEAIVTFTKGTHRFLFPDRKIMTIQPELLWSTNDRQNNFCIKAHKFLLRYVLTFKGLSWFTLFISHHYTLVWHNGY